VRPVALDDSAHFVVDSVDGVKLLDLHADGFELVRIERAAFVELHWHFRLLRVAAS
jgi:hypothetical protein